MDYISNQNPPRSFCRIDLSQPDDVIHKKLDSYINQMNIYISCTRKHNDLFREIRLRLNKYDLNVLPDLDSCNSGAMFAKEIEKQIGHAANNGYYVFLYSKDIVYSSFVAKEFELAYELGAKVILFTLDKESATQCNNDNILSKYQIIDVSDSSDKEKADDITNRILDRILPVGGLMTHAENFRTGRMGVKDKEEAFKLHKYLFDKAQNSENPYALQYIGKCYEYGWLGKVDLNKALTYYIMARYEPGGPKDESFIKHIVELNQIIHSKSWESKFSKFWNKITSIFRK